MHNHNHNPDATWETSLVIPEAAKPIDVQTLDALLRIEGILQKLVTAKGLEALAAADAALLIDEAPKKGKRKP